MTDAHALVRAVLVAEAVILAGALLVLFGHAAWMRVRARRWEVPMERGRRALLAAVEAGRPARADLQVLRGLPVRLLVRVFAELAPALAGRSRDRLRVLAREVGLAPVAERLCRGRAWSDRLRGVRLLTALGGGADVVPPLLDDRDPAVRAAAVEWAAAHATPALVERLVRLLPATDRYGTFVVRDSLLRVGAPAVGPLARWLERRGGAQAEGALDVAAGIPDPAFAPAALRLCADPHPGVRARAAALAGAIGSEEAVGVLQRLASDADADVRAAAASALGRLGHWPSAAVIAPLLRDRAWTVRSRTALALRALGSPGVLFLRRALADEDPFAADMARQVLDLPETAAEREQRA